MHLAAWGVIFGFPYLLLPGKEKGFNIVWSQNWLALAEYAIIFYLNYFFLLNRFLFRKKYVVFVLLNLVLVVLFLWFNFEVYDSIFREKIIHFREGMMNSLQREHGPRVLHFSPGYAQITADPVKMKYAPSPAYRFILQREAFLFFIPAIFSIALKATENWMKTESEKKEMVTRNLESELQHLKYQLQPHFFFNSLNNIYSLVEKSPAGAREAIHNLSKLMRYLLYEAGKKVELSQEIEFLKKYIQLMELRHTDRTTVHYHFPELDETDYSIAPLLFIPMIENAYKHGISATQPSEIRFEMNIRNNQLFFSSTNSNFPKLENDKSGSGVGLDNLKKRLKLLYPGHHELDQGITNNIFWIMLRIDLTELREKT